MSAAAGANSPLAKADVARPLAAGDNSPGTDVLVSVLVAVSAGAVRAGSSALTPSSLRSLVREVRKTYPQLAARPLAEVGFVRGSGRAEVRLFFGSPEGESAPPAK